MSYNILADRLASIPKFQEYVPVTVRDFSFRSRRIIGELFDAKADLVCLQEVDNFDEFYRE
jgi:mRNA deadenylase 3'-5' endonuclease subunit Ccr4